MCRFVWWQKHVGSHGLHGWGYAGVGLVWEARWFCIVYERYVLCAMGGNVKGMGLRGKTGGDGRQMQLHRHTHMEGSHNPTQPMHGCAVHLSQFALIPSLYPAWRRLPMRLTWA